MLDGLDFKKIMASMDQSIVTWPVPFVGGGGGLHG